MISGENQTSHPVSAHKKEQGLITLLPCNDYSYRYNDNYRNNYYSNDGNNSNKDNSNQHNNDNINSKH